MLSYGDKTKEISGGEPATTNNRMELKAAVEALKQLKMPCKVEFHTDSEYLRNGITSWISGWKRFGWKTKDKKPVRNADLWKELDAAATPHTISWNWVKGHSGNQQNERCDTLACEEISKIQTKYSKPELKTLLEAFRAEQSSSTPAGQKPETELLF